MNIIEMRKYKAFKNMNRIIEEIKTTELRYIEVRESDIESEEVEELKSLGYTVEWQWANEFNYYLISGW